MINSIKKFKTILISICFIIFFSITAFAGTAKIQFNDPITTRGKNFELILKVKAEDVRLKSADITISYDNNMITFVNGTKGTVAEGGAGTVRVSGTNTGVNTKTLTYNMSFTAVQTGTTEVKILNNTVVDTNENSVNIIHEGKSTITIKPSSTQSKNANLKNLTFGPGEMEPEFSQDISVYSTEVNPGVDMLSITAEREDSDATVQITGNENFQPGNNVVTITVTAPNGKTKKTYTINVNKLEVGPAAGDTEYVGGVKLGSREYSVRVYPLNEEDDKYFPGYYRTNPKIENVNISNTIEAYAPILEEGQDADYFIFYGVDTTINESKPMFYRYDKTYRTIQRYIKDPNDQNLNLINGQNNLNEENTVLKTNYQRLLYLLIASLVIIIILIAVILMKSGTNKNNRRYEEDYDDEEDDDDYFQSDIKKKNKNNNKYEEDYDDEIEELV